MRPVTSTLIDAIEIPLIYEMDIEATLEQSLVFFEALFNEDPGFPDPPKWEDDPMLEEIGIYSSGSGVSSWVNDGGTLKYQTNGSASVVSTGISIRGKPGIFGNKLFLDEAGTIKRYDIDWASVEAHSGSPLSNANTVDATNYTSGSPIIHAVSENGCVVTWMDNNGVRSAYHVLSGTWLRYAMPKRFMYPVARNYVSSLQAERSDLSHVTFTTALKFNDDVYSYVSNSGTGGVDGICWNHTTQTWGDIFVAIPADIDVSQSEFRIANSYVSQDACFIVGQFIRRKEADNFVPYTLISQSTNGRTFALGRLSAVSNIGWRFLAGIGGTKLWLNAGNRVCSGDATYYYLGCSGSSAGPTAIAIPNQAFGTVSDSSLHSNSVNLKAGNEFYMFHPNMKAGSRVQMKAGMRTAIGAELFPWGSYIIDGFDCAIADGVRSIQPRLVNESEWNMSGFNSPHYTEIISKSSLIDDLKDFTYMYTAGSSGRLETSFSVDFWGCESYEDTTASPAITPCDIILKGGVGSYTSGSGHNMGIKSKDLTELLGSSQYPTFTGEDIVTKIYGWSYALDDFASVDQVRLLFFCRDQNNNDSVITGSLNSFPANSAPIEFTLTSGSAPVGLQLIAIGLVFNSAEASRFNAVRVDFLSGVNAYFDDESTWNIEKGVGFKVPGIIQPYIMFTRKPYDAFNFIIGGDFTQDILGYQTGYAVGYGLVGLALDGSNYICGRRNISESRLEIVKCRNRVETVLAYTSCVGGASERLEFQHSDGHFVLSSIDQGELTVIDQVTYDWTSSDGWMFLGNIQPMHCGIYGIINLPYFYTAGFDMGADEEETNACAIGFLPGQDVTKLHDWASSGRCVIDENIYSYGSKVDAPEDNIRGPFQFRNNGDGSEGTYTPPYGTGEPGLECMDSDWGRSAGYGTDSIIALDDGGSYICTDTFWQVFNSSGGENQDIHGRARYYGSNSPIGTSFHDLSNRVYLTAGLNDILLVKGEIQFHSWRSIVHKDYTGGICCGKFYGSSGNSEVTVENLIDTISRYCGAKAEFPGNDLTSDLDLSDNNLHVIGSFELTDGFDVSFTIPQMAPNEGVIIWSDTKARGSTYNTTEVVLITSGSGLFSVFLSAGLTDFFGAFSFVAPETAHRIRCLYHDNFVSFFMDDRWIYTFGVTPLHDTADPLNDIPGITYSTMTYVSLQATPPSAPHATDIVCSELCDWREAIYLDMNTDGSSAIQNVIQQRPVEIVVKSNGALSYSYNAMRDSVTPVENTIRKHNWTEQFPKNGASDAIIYYRDTKTIQDYEYARRYGLSTKIMHMPDLSTGALRASRILLRRYLEQSVMHTVILRPDIRIEPGDLLNIYYVASGTETSSEITIVVESVDFSYDQKGSVMTVRGREYIP
jgi:hypothetical protein